MSLYVFGAIRRNQRSLQRLLQVMDRSAVPPAVIVQLEEAELCLREAAQLIEHHQTAGVPL